MTTLLLIAVVLSGAPPKADKGAADVCHVYPKRCEPGCRKAHKEATSPDGMCAKEVKAFNDALAKKPDSAAALGKCLAACTPKGDMTCVGPPSAAACDCQSECFKQSVPDALEAGRALVKCYQPAVASVCE